MKGENVDGKNDMPTLRDLLIYIYIYIYRGNYSNFRKS